VRAARGLTVSVIYCILTLEFDSSEMGG